MERLISLFVIFSTLIIVARIDERRNSINLPPISFDSGESITIIPPENSDNNDQSIEHEVVLTKNVTLYLNPSVQANNMYINGLGTEAEHMNDIANLMYDELIKYSFINTLCNCSSKGLSLSQSVQESNYNNVDLHLSLHSNAGGGKGIETYGKGDYKFARAMYDGFNKLGDFSKRGVKDGSGLYEIKYVKATHVTLMELLFHDNLEEALFIINNKVTIAQQLVTTLIDFVIDNYSK